MHESEKEREVTQLCLTFSDPMDYSLPGSCIHGILQARVLEWGAIAFSFFAGRLLDRLRGQRVCELYCWMTSAFPTSGLRKISAYIFKKL